MLMSFLRADKVISMSKQKTESVSVWVLKNRVGRCLHRSLPFKGKKIKIIALQSLRLNQIWPSTDLPWILQAGQMVAILMHWHQYRNMPFCIEKHTCFVFLFFLASMIISTEGSMVYTYLTIEIIYKKKCGFVIYKTHLLFITAGWFQATQPTFQNHYRVKCSPSL